jgi:hypothetical protein
MPDCDLSMAEALAKHKIKPPKTDMSCTNRKRLMRKRISIVRRTWRQWIIVDPVLYKPNTCI